MKQSMQYHEGLYINFLFLEVLTTSANSTAWLVMNGSKALSRASSFQLQRAHNTTGLATISIPPTYPLILSASELIAGSTVPPDHVRLGASWTLVARKQGVTRRRRFSSFPCFLFRERFACCLLLTPVSQDFAVLGGPALRLACLSAVGF